LQRQKGQNMTILLPGHDLGLLSGGHRFQEAM
jgi:hypothetical protein